MTYIICIFYDYIQYLCVKYESNILIFSKDIEWKQFSEVEKKQ